MFFKTFIQRGSLVESCHMAKCLVKDLNDRILLSSNNDQEFIYPRSAIKIFQALPFVNSGAHKKFDLGEKILAISCSSHCGELKHLKILNNWLKKINLPLENIKCGIHNPINLKSSNDLYLGGHKPSQLHNNCSGKHLAMLSGCLSNKMKYENYLDVNHPYQGLIRDSIEYFTASSIQKKNLSTR